MASTASCAAVSQRCQCPLCRLRLRQATELIASHVMPSIGTAPPRPFGTPRLPLPVDAAPLDNGHRVETPEGIDLVLRPAGLVPRALAFAIDLVLRAAIVVVLGLALGALGQFGMGLSAIVLFIVQWWYMVLFEVLDQGRTPGKRWLGLRVVHDDGTPVGWSASLIRNLLRFVDLLPFGYFFGALCCLAHPCFKRIGDLAAGTLVIHRERPSAQPALPQVAPQPAPVALSFEEQRALIAFSERHASLSPERRAELATVLAAPLGLDPRTAEDRLHAFARSALGPT